MMAGFDFNNYAAGFCSATPALRGNEVSMDTIDLGNNKSLEHINVKAQVLLDYVERIELAAKRGLDLAQAHIHGIPAEKTISAEQCEWILKDCCMFRRAICRSLDCSNSLPISKSNVLDHHIHSF
ncbi:hypothetical protein ACRWUU_21710 [Escherichia coli]|nr:putative prophage protein [Escherichia coli]